MKRNRKPVVPADDRREFLRYVATAGLLAGLSGCSSRKDGVVGIRMNGSDTMVNLAQAWAERYHRVEPMVEIQVLGAGSGVGIADLVDGKCDLANSSRPMKKKEFDSVVAAHGGIEPVGHIVGHDAMALYIHRDNPVKTLSLEQLAEIYGNHPTITHWSQLTNRPAQEFFAGRSDEIIPIARQNSSGTYSYFRDVAIGNDADGKKRDYRLGTVDANGSKDVVALVSRSPVAIGYSGMGYKIDEVDWIALSKETGQMAYEPSLENAKNGKYPITRPLIIYTVGELDVMTASGKFLEWIVSEEGQNLVTLLGYVPIERREAVKHDFA